MTYWEREEKGGRAVIYLTLLLGYNTPSKSSLGRRKALFILTGCSLSLGEIRARTQQALLVGSPRCMLTWLSYTAQDHPGNGAIHSMLALLHTITIKTIAHSHVHSLIWPGQPLLGTPFQVTLGGVELTFISNLATRECPGKKVWGKSLAFW